jgi:hypothetical protein
MVECDCGQNVTVVRSISLECALSDAVKSRDISIRTVVRGLKGVEAEATTSPLRHT